MTHVRDNDGIAGGNQCPTLPNPSGEGGIGTSHDDPNDQYVLSLLSNYDGGMEGGPVGSAQDGGDIMLYFVRSEDGQLAYDPDYDVVGGNRELLSADQGGIVPNDPNDQYAQSSVAGEELDQASLGHGEDGGQSNAALQAGHVQYDPSQRDERKKSTSWTELEHKILLVAMEEYGRGNWKQIWEEVLTSKRPCQIASHAQKYFKRQKVTEDEKKRRSVQDIGLKDLTEEDWSYMERLFKKRFPSRSQPGLSRPHPMPGQPQECLVGQTPAVFPSSYQSGTAGHPHGHLQAPAMQTMPARHEPVTAPSNYVHTSLPPPCYWSMAPSSMLNTHPQNPEYRSTGGMHRAVYNPAEVQLPAAPIPEPTRPPGLQAVEPLYNPDNYFGRLLNGENPSTPPHLNEDFLTSLREAYRD